MLWQQSGHQWREVVSLVWDLQGIPFLAAIQAAKRYRHEGRWLDAASYGSTYLLEAPEKFILKVSHPAGTQLGNGRNAIPNFDFTSEVTMLAQLPKDKDDRGLQLIGLIEVQG